MTDLAARFGIFDAMAQSRATPLRDTAVGGAGAWLVHWRNADTETAYRKPGHHTVSLYLRGGERVRCRDKPAARGGAGSLCLLPSGHESRWDVDGSLELLHVYLPQLALAEAAERWFDADPRSATLADRIYVDDPVLAALGTQAASLDWAHTDAPLQLQHLVLAMQARLLAQHTGMRRIAAPRGGLSTAARRRVLERIEAAGAATPTLAQLAEAACLSEFHFARMFKRSFGMPPHAWVAQRRLARARALLAQAQPAVAEVAARTGYAHASHLNAALRGAGLGSAARLRRAVRALA